MTHHTASSRPLRFLRCTLNEAMYGLDMAWVQGVEPAAQLHRQTGASGAVGWFARGPETVPVFSPARLWHSACQDSEPAGQIVVLKTRPQATALLVEQVDSVIEVPPENVLPLPALARNPAAPYFSGVVQCSGTLMLCLDPAQLLPGVACPATPPQPGPDRPAALPPMVERAPAWSSQRRLICFTTGDGPAHEPAITFGLSVSQVPHVLTAGPLRPLPGAAAGILGLVTWQGCPLTVIDLSRCLGGPASGLSADSRLLVARASTRRAGIAFPVRPDVSISHFPLEQRASTRRLPLHEHLLRGKFDLVHSTLVVPDIDRILTTHLGPEIVKEALPC